MFSVINNIYKCYSDYLVTSLITNRITYDNIKSHISSLDKNLFSIEVIGQSINNRDIHCITFGKGDVNILAWSQMHGDEPTATAVIFDLINFFSKNDEYNQLRIDLLTKFKIHLIPMLNPDGSEEHKRENSIGIDINRDALRTRSPESQLLWKLSKKIKPDFAFNLHDQDRYYTPGRSRKTSVISLLAPPSDYDKSVFSARKKSMQVISFIFNHLSKIYPDQIARYKDDFEPRAFGDNLIKNGISTILIESGILDGDCNKNIVRKLTFIALLSALQTISTNSYETKSLEDYYSIPENEILLFDLLIRNLQIIKNNTNYKIDIGINRLQKYDIKTKSFYHRSIIQEIGDLSIYNGIEEYDLDGYDVEHIKVFQKTFLSFSELKSIDFHTLHEQGYGIVKYESGFIDFNFTELPINILPFNKNYSPTITKEDYANLVISKNNKIDFVIVNGFLKAINNSNKSILNGIVIS